MLKKIKIVTCSQLGGVLDYSKIIQKKLQLKGYNSSIIKVSKSKKKISNKINQNDHVILQMSAYGYQSKGLPFWLLNEVKLIKKKTSHFSIFFHELFISRKIWEPRFFIMIMQKYINLQLLKHCNHWVTNNLTYFNWLNKHSPNTANHIISIPSLIDHEVKKINKDKKMVILFGTPDARTEIYKNYFYVLKNWLIKNDLLLFDVGSKIEDKYVKNLLKKQNYIKICGRLNSLKVSNLLAKAYLGFFSKPDDIISKSSVFAAYCKHKVCPINLENFDENNKKLLKKKNYLLTLPHNNIHKKIISNIVKINFQLSKKNNIEKHINIILKYY